MSIDRPRPVAAPAADARHRPVGQRRIAVVPAYNEEPTVADGARPASSTLVDELVVVDDGSTDGTRGRDRAAGCPATTTPACSCSTRTRACPRPTTSAFTDLRQRIIDGELSADDLVFTIDADGQHELAVLEELQRIMLDEGARRPARAARPVDLPAATSRPATGCCRAWATLWAGGVRCTTSSPATASSALGALADALDYYQGYKYSETVEVAVVLCRLGYKVRNDVLVPVPVYRSPHSHDRRRHRPLVAIPAAAVRVQRRRPATPEVPGAEPGQAARRHRGLAVAGGRWPLRRRWRSLARRGLAR